MEERNSMRLHLTVGLWLTAALLLMGCTAGKTGSPATVNGSDAYERPENAYYYYMESQLAKGRGASEQSVAYLEKAAALQPDSVFLKKELALEYLQQENTAGALELIDAILAQDPDHLESLILYGRIMQERGNLEQAKQAYEKVIALDSSRENVFLLLGRIYLSEDNDADALRVFQTLVEQNPQSYPGHFFLGKLYARQEQYEAAEREYQKALEIEPALLEPRFELLNLYQRQGKSPGVLIDTYEEILENNPGNIQAMMEVGLLYWKNDRKDEARALFSDLAQRSDSSFEVVLKVIQTYLETDRYDDGLMVIEGVLASAPQNSDLQYLAGVAYYGKKDFDNARKHFGRVQKDSRFYKDAVVHLAFVNQEQGNTAKAVEYLQEAILSDPENAEYYYYLGTFQENAEAYAEAVGALEKAIERNPEETKYRFRLGVVYDKWGQKEASIEIMRDVIELDPTHASALNYLGYTYADLGKNLDEAERLIKKALTYKPNDGYITDSLGWVYYKQGRYEEALSVLKTAVEMVPDDPIILEHLGDAYLKVGDRSNALRYYRLSLEHQNQDPEALNEKIRRIENRP